MLHMAGQLMAVALPCHHVFTQGSIQKLTFQILCLRHSRGLVAIARLVLGILLNIYIKDYEIFIIAKNKTTDFIDFIEFVAETCCRTFLFKCTIYVEHHSIISDKGMVLPSHHLLREQGQNFAYLFFWGILNSQN